MDFKVGDCVFFDNSGSIGYRRILRIDGENVYLATDCSCKNIKTKITKIFHTKEELKESLQK